MLNNLSTSISQQIKLPRRVVFLCMKEPLYTNCKQGSCNYKFSIHLRSCNSHRCIHKLPYRNPSISLDSLIYKCIYLDLQSKIEKHILYKYLNSNTIYNLKVHYCTIYITPHLNSNHLCTLNIRNLHYIYLRHIL